MSLIPANECIAHVRRSPGMGTYTDIRAGRGIPSVQGSVPPVQDGINAVTGYIFTRERMLVASLTIQWSKCGGVFDAMGGRKPINTS